MENQQYYQPLSHALHPPLVPTARSPQPLYAPYSHAQPAANGSTNHNHREEEEEEEEDDEEVVEEELETNDHHSTHSSPRASDAQAQARSAGPPATPTNPKQPSQAPDGDSSEKRKPGRPRGSRNRKRTLVSSSSKAPANSQHPGFYQYPPVPGGAIQQNQQFYEFQWRALNLCSEFYNAAEELVKAASPIVIAQCYQAGPATKIDPLVMITEAKRVCDNLLANPSQLVGQAPPVVYPPVPAYSQMLPPSAAGSMSPSATNASGTVITNPQSFVMSLGAPAMAAPSHAPHPQSYYPQMYAAHTPRYPTAPYYSYPPQHSAPYYPAPAPAPQHTHTPTPAPVQAPPPAHVPAPAQAPAPAPPPASISTSSAPVQATSAPAPASAPAIAPLSAGTISTFNAATGTVAPGGQQGTWSEEETDRLKKLAEQSREMGGPQNKGEIEWDWVVHQWGNTRTRHQILLKATALGLKVSTTRGTKRRRETDVTQPDAHGSAANNANSTSHAQSSPASHAPSNPVTPIQHAAAPPTKPSPAQTSPPSASASANASPAIQPRPPSSSAAIAGLMAPPTPATTSAPTAAPSTSNMPWPMPTVAANTPSPVLGNSSTQMDVQRGNYYRQRPTGTTPYGAAAAANSNTGSRPGSSHGGSAAHHSYMFRPNGAGGAQRRDG